MRRCPVVPVLVGTLLFLVPRSLADTQWTTGGSLKPFAVLSLNVEEKGKATFTLEPDIAVSILLSTAPARVEFHGMVKPTTPGSTQFPLNLVLLGGAGTKASEVKSGYKFSSKKDPATALYGFLDILLLNVDSHLPVPWLGTMVMTSSAKFSGKTTVLSGPASSGVIKLSFAGLTMLNKAFKAKLTFYFAGATPAP